jgi:hypothetical protein
VYFVPRAHEPELRAIERFVGELKGRLTEEAKSTFVMAVELVDQEEYRDAIAGITRGRPCHSTAAQWTVVISVLPSAIITSSDPSSGDRCATWPTFWSERLCINHLSSSAMVISANFAQAAFLASYLTKLVSYC